MTRRNPYSTDLAVLRDYLKRGFDPYDYANMLEEFYDEVRDGVAPNWFDANDPWRRVGDMSKRDKKEFEDWALSQTMGALSPSTVFFRFQEILPRKTWLVHFTNDTGGIVSKGFSCGSMDMTALGLTTHFSHKDCVPGWNFAFEVSDRDASNAADSKKYGKNAIMFQSSGVAAYHWGDEENQVIFWGPSVSEVIPLWRSGEGFQILRKSDDRVIVEGDYDDIQAWVRQNHAQYKKAIAYEV